MLSRSLKSYDASTTPHTTTLPRPWSRNGTRSLETDTSTLASLSYPLETLASHRRPLPWEPRSDKVHGRHHQLLATRALLRRMVTRDPSPRSPQTTPIRPTSIHFRKLPKRTSTQHQPESSLVLSRTLCVPSLPRSPLPSPMPPCSTPNVRLSSRYRQLVTWLSLNDTNRHHDVYQTRRFQRSRWFSARIIFHSLLASTSTCICGLRTRPSTFHPSTPTFIPFSEYPTPGI